LKYLQVNDVHSSDQPPKWRKESYNEDIFAKLENVVEIAREENVDFICLTGDLFHVPTPSRVSHALVNRWMKLFDSFHTWYVIVGNHDLAGPLSQLHRQPIGVFDTHNNVTIFKDGAVITIEDYNIGGIHWDYKVNKKMLWDIVGEEKLDVLFTHAPIQLKANPFFETIGWGDLDGIAKVVSYGHMHIPEKPGKLKTTWFVNPGSLSRRCLGSQAGAEDDQNRIPQVALVELNGGDVSVNYIPVIHKPAEDVYRLETFDFLKSENEEVNQFVQSLGESSIGQVTIESLVEKVKKLTNDDSVLEKAVDLLYKN